MTVIVGGILYLIGLILLIMPPQGIPWFDGERQIVRVVKHVIALSSFATGVITIHRVIRKNVGATFILVSCILILVIGLFRIWQEKSN